MSRFCSYILVTVPLGFRLIPSYSNRLLGQVLVVAHAQSQLDSLVCGGRDSYCAGRSLRIGALEVASCHFRRTLYE